MRRLWPLLLVPLLMACTATPSSAPSARPPTASSGVDASEAAKEAAIEALLKRPLRMPTVAPGAPCPVSEVTERSGVVQPADARGLGKGPLYPITFYIGENATLRLGKETAGPEGLYELKVVWAASAGYRGPAVVRLGRIDGTGRGHVSLFYDSAARRGDAVVFPASEFPSDFPSATAVSGPGCYAYQIDGAGLEEIIVFRVVK
jgi:hypothetical protein